MQSTRNADVTHQNSEGGISQPTITKADRSQVAHQEIRESSISKKFKLLMKHTGPIENSKAESGQQMMM